MVNPAPAVDTPRARDAAAPWPARTIDPREPASRFDSWRKIIATGNLPEGRAMDGVSRWLLITRACVFSMTITSALIGGLLAAATAPSTHWGWFALALLGLVIAHANNNMINDYFDTTGGVDTESYTRALYAPHPLLSGLISKRGLVATIVALNVADLAILWILASARGWPVVAFALAGLFVSVFYVAPPLKLKHHGLGEPGVFLVWGPLMICGTYYVTAGVLPAWVWLASVPYALVVTTVLIGKHIDKLEQDGSRGIHTLPVLLGRSTSLHLNQALMIAFYAIVAGLVLRGTLGVAVLLVAFAIPRLIQVLKAYAQPKPATAPPGYRLWPLWFVSLAFYHNRLAGGLFVLGLALNALLGL
jgi:1,4-dihydroxy-2-naphthoate octaprenyltransferase